MLINYLAVQEKFSRMELDANTRQPLAEMTTFG